MRIVLSIGSFSAALAFVVFRFDYLAHYGLHGIAIGFLFFYFWILIGLTANAQDHSNLEADRWRQYARLYVLSHAILVVVCGLLYVLRWGVRYLFRHILPEEFEVFADLVFIGLFLLLIWFVYRVAENDAGGIKAWWRRLQRRS